MKSSRTLLGFRALAFCLLAQFLLGYAFAQAAAGSRLVYVGTYTDHGSKGIYAYRFDLATGKVAALGLAAESANPSFLALSANGRLLYAVNEVNRFNGQPVGSVSSFSVDAATGKLSALNQVSAGGEGPAYITLDRTGKYALVANYPLGSVAVFPVLKNGQLGEATAFVQHKGSSVNPERQQGPHAHAIAMSPDNRFAIVADLGLDQLIVYPFDSAKGRLGPSHVLKTAPGAGPRHLAFAPHGKLLYVINEMASSIGAYSYDATNGTLHEFQTISTLPQGFTGMNTAAEIEVAPSGKFLYASNRGNDSLAVFALDPVKGALALVEFDPAGGKTPRNFTIDPTGSWLLAANQDSGNIVVFRLDARTGHLTPTGEVLQLSNPVCVKFVPGE
jgi:6-phosphogluconolactonase